MPIYIKSLRFDNIFDTYEMTLIVKSHLSIYYMPSYKNKGQEERLLCCYKLRDISSFAELSFHCVRV